MLHARENIPPTTNKLWVVGTKYYHEIYDGIYGVIGSVVMGVWGGGQVRFSEHMPW